MEIKNRMLRTVTVLAACTGIAACGDVGSESATLGETAQPSAATPTVFKIGDPVNFDAFEISIKNVEQKQSVGASILTSALQKAGLT